MSTHYHSTRDAPVDATLPKQARDPVCGMTPKPDSVHRVTHAGAEVLFCSAGCKAKFEADPARYASAEAQGSDEAT